jgi:hypothetical protein
MLILEESLLLRIAKEALLLAAFPFEKFTIMSGRRLAAAAAIDYFV